MTRQLLLLRHAKSSWDDPALDDYERPLNRRGQRDAPRMGRLITEWGLAPDRIVSSSALRARITVELAADSGEWTPEIEVTESLYLAPPDEYLAWMQSTSDDVGKLLLIGHNPGIEECVEQLTDEVETMPTAALAHIELPWDRWSESQLDGRSRLVAVYRPKELS